MNDTSINKKLQRQPFVKSRHLALLYHILPNKLNYTRLYFAAPFYFLRSFECTHGKSNSDILGNICAIILVQLYWVILVQQKGCKIHLLEVWIILLYNQHTCAWSLNYTFVQLYSPIKMGFLIQDKLFIKSFTRAI